MPTSFVSDRVARVRRNPWIMGLAALPWSAAAVALLTATALRLPALLVFFPHLVIFGGIALAYAWRKNAYARHVPAKVEAGDEGVRIDGQLVVGKAGLKSGMVLPRAEGGPVVRLQRRGARLPIDLRVSDRDEGRHLLRALGLDASQSVATFSLPSMAATSTKWRRRILGGLFGGMGAIAVVAAMVARASPVFAGLPALIMIPLILAVTVVSAIPSKLKVGADGLHLSWLRTARFLGYGDIARIDLYEDPGLGKQSMEGLSVVMKSGEQVKIPIQRKRGALRDRIDILYERIAEAIETWGRGDGVADAALVRRGGRDAAEWVRSLRGLGSFANADARTAPVLPEKLWRIVEDPAAPADARAGAAVALGLGADDEVRARLRAAASATAAPKLRVAIESAAGSGPDEALLAALAEVEGEAAAAAKRA